MTEMNLSESSVNTYYPDLYSTLNVNYCRSTCRVGGYHPGRTKPSIHSVLQHGIPILWRICSVLLHVQVPFTEN